MAGIFCGKTLMITGGTGSFGEAVLNRFLDTDIAEIRIFSRKLENGDVAYALFNMTAEERTGALEVPGAALVRDVWMKENLPAADSVSCVLPPHGVRLLRVTPA